MYVSGMLDRPTILIYVSGMLDCPTILMYVSGMLDRPTILMWPHMHKLGLRMHYACLPTDRQYKGTCTYVYTGIPYSVKIWQAIYWVKCPILAYDEFSIWWIVGHNYDATVGLIV